MNLKNKKPNLEKYYTIQSNKIELALSLVKSLTLVCYDEFDTNNNTFNNFDFERILNQIKDNLEPIAEELTELQINQDYLYYEDKDKLLFNKGV